MCRAPARVAVALLLVLAAPGAAPAQVFFAAEAHAPMTVGPLFVSAVAPPEPGPMTVTVSWNIVASPGRRAAAQTLHLFWPAEIAAATAPGDADADLVRYVDARGFAPVGSGRLVLRARSRTQIGLPTPAEPVAVTVSYVSFVRRGAPAQAGAGSLIRIPPVAELGDPAHVMSLPLPLRGLVGPKPATWLEEIFWGRRNVLTVSWGDVGSISLYPIYFEHRDRILQLAREYSMLVASFPDAEHLRIEDIAPATAVRRGSRLRAGAETVAIALNTAEGATPQALKVQFAYFSGWFAWRPVLISLGLLVLGNITGLMILSGQLSSFLRARLWVRRPGRDGDAAILRPGALAAIEPGTSTYEDVIRALGVPDEHRRRVGDGDRRTLVYRATRRLPEPGLTVGWLATVRRWEIEHHEVEVEVAAGRARDVVVRVRRSNGSTPE